MRVEDIRADCIARLERANASAEAIDRVRTCRVEFNARGKKTAGWANWIRRLVVISTAFPPESWEATLRHEFAHIARGSGKHDLLWQKTDIVLGGTGERYHSMGKMKTRTEECACKRCGEVLQMSRVRCIQSRRRERVYSHRGCGGVIFPLDEFGAGSPHRMRNAARIARSLARS